VVQSVDRAKLLPGLARAAQERGRALEVLVQVSLDPPETQDGRNGVVPTELDALAAEVNKHDALRLRGLMAVAPLGAEPADAFSRLRAIRSDFLTRHRDAGWLSAGMSGDLEEAIGAGATHVRVGTAILGSRPSIK
jgi:uncharacterized pyridoxal phosphate-containing UPF0001 family protein